MSTKTRRLMLGNGDIVSIVGETEDSEWGSGLARAWAQVEGHKGGGWYAGVLEDGSPVEFHEDQVEELLDERAGLSGIRDWFGRKAPAPGPTGLPALPQDPGGSIIYVGPTGVAKYEEAAITPEKPKGFFSAIKESVSSIVDAFKGATGLTPRPDTPITPYEKKPSMFAAFAPDAPKPLQSFQERVTSFVVPKGPGPLAPFVESAKELFSYVEPSPEPESYEARATRQQELWSGMFQPAKEGPSLFEAFKPSEVIMPEDAQLPPVMQKQVDQGSIDVPIIPLPARTTLLPAPEDVARGLLTLYDPIDKNIFDRIREERESPEFQEAADACMDFGDPAAIIIESLAGNVENRTGDSDVAIAALLQIPWSHIESRMEWDPRKEWVVNEDELQEEIFWPAQQVLSEAFDLIKPDDLPGSFEVYEHPDYGHAAIMYLECHQERPSRIPGEGPGEAFAEDEGDGPVGEVYEDNPEQLREYLDELAEDFRKLDPKDAGYEDLKAQIEFEMSVTEERLAELEEQKVVKAKKPKKKTKKAKKAKKAKKK